VIDNMNILYKPVNTNITQETDDSLLRLYNKLSGYTQWEKVYNYQLLIYKWLYDEPQAIFYTDVMRELVTIGKESISPNRISDVKQKKIFSLIEQKRLSSTIVNVVEEYVDEELKLIENKADIQTELTLNTVLTEENRILKELVNKMITLINGGGTSPSGAVTFNAATTVVPALNQLVTDLNNSKNNNINGLLLW